MKTISLWDWGKTIRVTLKTINGTDPFDPSGALEINIVFIKPDKTITAKAMSLYTNGADGKVTYTIEDGLIDQEGIWNFQVVVVATGYELYSDHVEFQVRPSLRKY